MPFLDEQELASLQKEIHDANVKRDELENDLIDKEELLRKAKSSGRGINLLFAILAGAGLAAAFFMYKNAASIKATSTNNTEVIDTTESVNGDATEESVADIKTLDESLDEIRSNTSGETVYSVQIGIFSKNKYPLLSETIAGTTSNDNYFKYSVGLFKTLEEAQDFRRQLVKVGFRDAFVASYIDGERQQIHQPN